MKSFRSRQPDPRWRGHVGDQADLVKHVEGWTVGDAVPPAVADVLRVARSLLIDSYFTYEYSLVAVTWALLAMEASLKGCLPINGPERDRRTFRHLINEARKRSLITKDEAGALNNAAELRNHIVHGHLQPKPSFQSYSPHDVMVMLGAIHEAVSDLYDRAQSSSLPSQ